MKEYVVSGPFIAKVLAGGAGGYIVAIILVHPNQWKLAALLGAAIVALIILLIPIFDTWYQTIKIKAWARGEVAKHRALQRARIEVGRVKNVAKGEIAGLETKVHSRKAQALSDETAIRMKLLVLLGNETSGALRDIEGRGWAPKVEELIGRLILLVAAGSRRIVAGWDNDFGDINEPIYPVAFIYILLRILVIEVLGVCIANPWIVFIILAASSFLFTFLGVSIAHLV